MMKAIKKSVRQWVKSVLLHIYNKMEAIAEADLPKFANNPKNLRIERPRRLLSTHRIYIGDDVSIGPGALFVPQVSYPSSVMDHPERTLAVQTFDSRIFIGNRVTSTGLLTIAAVQEIKIEDDVMFASNVLITDGTHGYENANEPYKYQKMWKIAPVLIKHGCWIGQNVVIMPGVTVGALSIVGSNSVVTKSIPDRCIAIGSPARVIKTWDERTQAWISVGEAP
jgi:acetyltransferase-like isoleucine patch superfamily enzyme